MNNNDFGEGPVGASLLVPIRLLPIAIDGFVTKPKTELDQVPDKSGREADTTPARRSCNKCNEALRSDQAIATSAQKCDLVPIGIIVEPHADQLFEPT